MPLFISISLLNIAFETKKIMKILVIMKNNKLQQFISPTSNANEFVFFLPSSVTSA